MFSQHPFTIASIAFSIQETNNSLKIAQQSPETIYLFQEIYPKFYK